MVAFLLPYLLGFWFLIYTSIHLLAGGDGDVGVSRWGAMLVVSTCTAVGIALAVILTRTVLKLSWSSLGLVRPAGLRITHGLMLFCTAYFFMWVAMTIFGVVPRVGEPTPPSDGSSPSALYVLTYSLLVGVGEELLIVAIPVAVMTALRWRWPIQILILTVLRTPFHLYYGYTAVLLAVVWSILYWLLYRRYRWVWPLIAAHTLYNCVTTSNAFGAAGSLILRLAALAVLLVGAGTVIRQVFIDRRRHPADVVELT